MDIKNYDLNKKIMLEIGLDQDDNMRLIDQDFGFELKAPDGRYFIAPNNRSNINSMEFNPAMNGAQAEYLFRYFGNKMALLDEYPRISTYFTQETNSNGMGYVEIVTEDNQRLRSENYVNESLRYLDIMMKMNGYDEVNLSEYDNTSKDDLIKIRRDIKKEERNTRRSNNIKNNKRGSSYFKNKTQGE